jgi:dipeptidyl aminopeptidase/acylaminoacyl peptidase
MPANRHFVWSILAASLIALALISLSGAPSRAQDEVATATPVGGGAGEIAFASDRDGNPEIYVMAADGSHLRNLTQNSASDLWPVWSPDGSQIAFMSNRDGNWEVYVMDADGSNPRNLTQNSADDGEPSWRPAPPH